MDITPPRAHLDRVNAVTGGDLLHRLTATDRLRGNPGLELGVTGAALAQLPLRRLRQRLEPTSSQCPASKVNKSRNPKKARPPQHRQERL